MSRDFELQEIPAVSPSKNKFFWFQGQGQGHECLKATEEELAVSPAWD